MTNEEFFKDIADQVGISVEDLLAAAQLNASRGDTMYMGSNQNYENVDYSQWAEFWERWREHTGNTGDDDKSGEGRFFSCSC